MAGGSGAVVGSTDLVACLNAPVNGSVGGLGSPSSGGTDIEILEGDLINAANGRIVAVGGVVH